MSAADAREVKAIASELGADLCGLASADRFAGAPPTFRPTDIDEDCRSVVVFAKKVPASSMSTASCVPYTVVNAWITQEVDHLTLEICRRLEEWQMRAVPIPSDDPYEHWEADREYGRAILSLRHAGHLAGLGVLGKNTLLINETFGNMIQIGAVLVDAELEADPIAAHEACPDGCRLCLQACPVQALDGKSVDQGKCRPLSNYRNEKGYLLKKCNRCRAVCPNALGIRHLR